MYVHADRGASWATKTSARATNMKHVGTREHTDEPRQRTQREREREVVNGPRVQDSGCLVLSLFIASLFPYPFLSLPFGSSCRVPRWLRVLIFLHNWRERAREEEPPVLAYVCNAASVFTYITPPRSLFLPFHRCASYNPFLSLSISIYRAPYVQTRGPTLLSVYSEERSARFCPTGRTERRQGALTLRVFSRKTRLEAE